MSKRNLLSIFIILICVFSICNSVFAYTTKTTENSYISDAMRYVEPNNLIDIQIDSVSAEMSDSTCAITVLFTEKIPQWHAGNRKFYPHFLISIPYPDKSKYPNTMNIFVKSDTEAIERTATINGVFLSKLIYGKQKYVINAPMDICNNKSGVIDLYVFIPNNRWIGRWNNVIYYDGGVRIREFDLKSESSYLDVVDLKPSYGAIKARYFYNVDYAYGVPVQNNQKQSVPKEQTNVTASVKDESKQVTAPVKDESKQVKAKAECDASFVSVSGYPYKYKCNEDGTRYIVCIDDKIEGDHEFKANSQLKAVLCPEPQTEKTTTKVTQQSMPQKTLAIELGGYIPEISFSLDNTTWYMVNKIDSPNAFVLESTAQNKTISIDLSMLNTGTVYAIITTADKKTDIDSELKEIYQTATFTSYIKDTPSNPFTINNINMPAKVEYTLDDSKHIKLKIAKESQLENIVLVFMQKSTDNTKVTIVYTNLYDLNSKSQSLFNLCQINKKIVNFYCTGYDCKSNASCLPSGRWDFDSKILEGLSPETMGTGNCDIDKQEDVDDYISCLRRNIEIVDLTQKYSFISKGKVIRGPIVGNTLIDEKYPATKVSSNCTGELFNNTLFKVAQENNLSEEEKAQLWARIAAESSCNVNVNCGKLCGSTGVAQIEVSMWDNENSYNLIKPYLLKLKNSYNYSDWSKYHVAMSGLATNPDTAIEISIAINNYHRNLIINKSNVAPRPLTGILDTTYDHDDSIDMHFATSYVYGGGASYASDFSTGITKGTFNVNRTNGVVAPALHKIGYYLTYKRMIYECHNSTLNNGFVTAYKKYGGTYCK